jgi:putative membrane protein
MLGFVLGAGLAAAIATRSRPGLAAIALLALLFITPLCALGSALFSARAGHHLVLMVAVAPLLASWLRPRAGIMTATATSALALWVWHAPAIYDAALASDAVFWAMQLSVLGSATLFWAALRRAPPLAGAAACLASTVQMGLLGALLAFAPSPLYASHLATTAAWGLSAVQDQALAGLLLWAPGAGLYLAAALALLWRGLEPRAALA